MRKIIIEAIKFSVKSFSYLFFAFLPSILVLIILTTPTINLDPPVKLTTISKNSDIHPIIPNTKWAHLKPCGVYFDEKENFKQALSCVNTKVWADNPLSEELVPPRCFVISTESLDVASTESAYNFVPVVTFTGIGAVVGFYHPETQTVYIVENIDADETYRHELQHWFLHLHDPSTAGSGHHQDIWQKCEGPYYKPSLKTKILGAVLSDK
jgi:hypothetical protein